MKKYLFNKLLVIFTFLYGFHCSSEQAIKDRDPDIVTIVSPAYDFSFKELFGNHLNILKGFLNSLYYPGADEKKGDEMIRKIDSKRDYSIGKKDTEGGLDLKDIYFDVSCKCFVWGDRKGLRHLKGKPYIFDVEMQRKVEPDYFPRSIFYGARILADCLEKGNLYGDLIPVKVVSFLNGILDKDEDWLYDAVICKKSIDGSLKEIDDSILKWSYIQLPKFSLDKEDMNDTLKQWISLMNVEALGEPDTIKNFSYRLDQSKYSDETVKEAIDVLKNIHDELFEKYEESVNKAKKLENFIEARIKKEREAKELAQKQAEEEREAKELAQKQAEEERQAREAAQEEVAKYKKLIEELQKRKLGQVIQESEQDSVNLKMARKEDQLENDLIDPE